MRVYTERTDRLVELHKNYKGRKNVIPDYKDVKFFDNVDFNEETGYFSASFIGEDIDYKKQEYTKLSEQEFIKFMELEDSKPDNVNKPSHYTQGGIEPIDYILANEMNFLEGNVIKYVTRYKHKNGLEDLKKAEFYLKKLTEGLA